ncbi:MAG: MBL fold metallo-hydrolase [Desulfuromusa sp.]|nr:MBL fold metallo-hydrolase [Desulfuromusa sp.]
MVEKIKHRFWKLLSLAIFISILSPFSVIAKVTPSIVPELAEHTKVFEKKVYKIADNVYSAVGWNLANTIMIVGEDGIIIVDVGESVSATREVAAEFRKITDKPVKAIIYTHFHPDHINGAKAFATEEQVRSGEIQIIAQDTLVDEVVNVGLTVGPIQIMRSVYQYGVVLSAEDNKDMNGGIGPIANVESSTFIAPTRTFKDSMTMTIAGVELRMYHVPSEAPDEICVYLPKSNILLAAEVSQGPTLPNFHTLRGVKFRDPIKWMDSLDFLRTFHADNMVPAHGQPVYGAEKVEEVLRYTRDGLQFIHDQTIRYMNKGLTPDELVEVVKFPPYLANYKPYLREYYGSVSHAVREIYIGYLGWFEGDPVSLDPIGKVEKARRMVTLMGGRDQVLAEAKKVLKDGDAQWSAELATFLVRIDKQDTQARIVKADALRTLGYASINITKRNWYLTSAMELENKLDVVKIMNKIRGVYASEDLIKNLPAGSWVRAWSPKLDPQKSGDAHMMMGFLFPDIGEGYGLEVRRAVAQFHPKFPENPDVALIVNKKFLNQIILKKVSFTDGIKSGDIKVSGNPVDVQKFMGFFDFGNDPINLTLR